MVKLYKQTLNELTDFDDVFRNWLSLVHKTDRLLWTATTATTILNKTDYHNFFLGNFSFI